MNMRAHTAAPKTVDPAAESPVFRKGPVVNPGLYGDNIRAIITAAEAARQKAA